MTPFATDLPPGSVPVVLLATFAVAAIVCSLVVRRGRHQRTTAERVAADMSVLRAVAGQVADGEKAEIVAMHAAFWLREMLGLRDCRLDRSTEPASPAFVDLGGVVRMGPLRWSAEVQGLPGPTVDLPMHADGVVVGRFVMTPEPGRQVLTDRLMTATALADLVAGAVREPELPRPGGASSTASPTAASHRSSPLHPSRTQRSIHG